MYDLFLLLFWFSSSECLTGKGLRVESRCVQVCARHAKRKWCHQFTLIIRQL